MAFDPSMIRRPKLTPEGLPEGASREERVAALANTLLERGLASSMASAKRLAEGMVDTERKILDQGSRRDNVASGASMEREKFQRNDSPLFKAIGGKAPATKLALPEPLERFVEKARTAKPAAAPSSSSPSYASSPPSPAPSRMGAPLSAPASSAPAPRMAEPARPAEPERWRIPERQGEAGYTKSSVEAGPSGVVFRHVEARAREDVMIERGVIVEEPVRPAAPAPAVAPAAPAPAEKKEELAKQHGVDLFSIFRASSSK